jgi:O-antigen/teichoic acid export membrane protein
MLALAGGHSGSTLVALAMTPFFYGTLGAAKYGLWMLFFSLVQYASVVDFGIGPGIVKYVAEDHTLGKHDAIRQMVTFASLFYLGVGAIFMMLFVIFGHSIIALIKMPEDIRPDAYPLLLGVAGYFFLSQLSFTLHGMICGLGRLDVSATIRAVSLIAWVFASFMALRLGFGLVGMLAGSFASLIVSMPILYAFARKEFGHVYCWPTAIHWGPVRRIFVTGGWIQLSSIMYLIYAQTNGIVIGLAVNVAAVAVYDLASRLSRSIRAIAYYVNAALLPAMSALEARSGPTAIHKALVDGSRYVAAISFCVSGFVISTAPIIFAAWLGSRAQNQRALLIELLIVLCITAVIENYIGVPSTVLRATGAPKVEAIYTVTTAFMSVLLIVLLVPRFGVLGVVVGSLVGSLIGGVLFLISFGRIRQVSIMDSFGKPLAKLFFVTVVSATATWLAVQFLVRHGTPSRPVAFLELAVGGCVYFTIFLTLLGVTSVFSSTDLAFVKRIVPTRFVIPIDRRFVRFLFAGR